MKYFLNDIKNFYFFKKKNFMCDREMVLSKLIISNVLFLENLDVSRLVNDLRLIESLSGFKYNKLKINYKNLFIKNRYLFLIIILKFKINYIYLYSFIDYLYYYEIAINFLLNVYNKSKILNAFKNTYLNDKLIQINSKLNYTFLSLNNKKRYRRIKYNYNVNLDNRLYICIYLYFKKIYYSKLFYNNFIENVKLRWLLNEKT